MAGGRARRLSAASMVVLAAACMVGMALLTTAARCFTGGTAAWRLPAPRGRDAAEALAGALGGMSPGRRIGSVVALCALKKAKTPRPKSAKTEADDQVFGVVAIELLYSHDRLDGEVALAFQRAVYGKVTERLEHHADCTTKEARETPTSWRLHDRVLEKQFSLGQYFTNLCSEKLGMFDSEGRVFSTARLAGRREANQAKIESSDDPVSINLVAWTQYNVGMRVGKEFVPLDCRSRLIGYPQGKLEVSKWCLPVFVEHDRSGHAERMALLSLGEAIADNGGKLHPDSKIAGTAWVYASHTPCISCLASFAQFRAKLPGVKLYVNFDVWGESRRWVHNGGLKEDIDKALEHCKTLPPPEPKPPPVTPTMTVQRLLEQAGGVDKRDYWNGWRWDLEGLREDAALEKDRAGGGGPRPKAGQKVKKAKTKQAVVVDADEDLSKLPLAKLKERLAAAGLPAAGLKKKADFIARLEEARAAGEGSQEEEEEEDEEAELEAEVEAVAKAEEEEDLGKLTNAALQKRLRTAGLPANGKKADLIARLEEAKAAGGESEVKEAKVVAKALGKPAQEATTETAQDLMKLKVDDLKSRLKANGQPTSGKKADLVDRLMR